MQQDKNAVLHIRIN